ISIPSSYILRGDSLRSTDPVTAIYFYELSIADTMWLITLASLRISEYITTATPQLTTVTPTTGAETIRIHEEESVSASPRNKYITLTTTVIVIVAVIIIALISLYLLERRRKRVF
ncbi:MAG: hypothetical protein ACP5I7_00515, partial [Sulfolobales archaeon]